MRGKWLLAASLALLGGCQSLEDIRASDPVRSASFEANYRAIADCVNFRLGHQLLVDPSARVARIIEPPGSWLTPTVHTYELNFQQVSRRRTNVSLHQRAMVPRDWGRDIWAYVEQCGAQLAQRPPS